MTANDDFFHYRAERDKLLARNESSGDTTESQEIGIEDALLEVGFQWSQAKQLAVLSFVAICVYAEMEAITLLGAELLCFWSLSGSQQSMMTMCFFMASIFGSVVFGKIADKFGRKRALQCASAVSFVALVLLSFSPGFKTATFFMCLAGFGRGGCCVMYTYCSELVGYPHRTTASLFVAISIGVGALIGSGLAIVTLPNGPNFWRLYLEMIAGMYVIAIFLLIECCESPRYLLISGQPSKALEVIQSFNPEKNKNATLIPVATEIRGSFREIYGNKECLKHVIILSTVAFCVRLIKLGASLQFIELLQQSQLPETRSCFIRKSVDIEKKCRKLETKDYEWEILAATSCLIAAFLAKILPDRFGRKVSLLIMGYLLIPVVIVNFFCKPLLVDVFLSAWSRTAATAANTILNLFGNELFPTSLRALCLGITVAGGEMGLSIAPLVVQYLSRVNYSAAVGCFLIAGALWVTLVHLIRKETKDTPQEDVSRSLEPASALNSTSSYEE